MRSERPIADIVSDIETVRVSLTATARRLRQNTDSAAVERELADLRCCAKALAALVDCIVLPREPTDEMCDAATRATATWLNSELRGVALRRFKLRLRFAAMAKAAPE
jgi:hypothetical protein